MTWLARLTAVLVLLIGTLQVASAARDDAQRSNLARGYIDHFAMPRFDRLQTATTAMRQQVAGFCADPREAGLRASRSAFKAAYLTWMAVQHIKFGPSLRGDAYFKLQFWPDKHGRAGRLLNGVLQSQEPVPDAGVLAELSAAVQGGPALERLLFDGDVTVFSGEAGARRCTLALSVSGNLATLTVTVAGDWRSYAPKDASEFVTRVYRTYLEMFATIAELKLKRPLGKSLKGARPKRSEAWRSGMSFAAVAQNFAALGMVFEGEGAWPGFRSVLDADQETQELADSLTQQIIYGSEVVSARPDKLSEAVATEPGRKFLDFLVVHAEQLKDTSIELLARPLGIAEGFNALDGD